MVVLDESPCGRESREGGTRWAHIVDVSDSVDTEVLVTVLCMS